MLWFKKRKFSCRPPRPPSKRTLLFFLLFQVLLFILGSYLYTSGYARKIWTTVTYATRPLWDTSDNILPLFNPIPHYYAEGVPMETLCSVHGWKWKSDTPNRVIDAVIFANELDMLEIRLRELYPVVDKFVIVESNRTFTNHPKPTDFKNHRSRFAWAEDKIVYAFFESPPVVTKNEINSGGFYLENSMRNFVTNVLINGVVNNGDMVIMADVDEIPSRHTISLVRHCTGYPESFHLGMRNFLYSFEFPVTHQAGYIHGSSISYAWRPRVATWTSSTWYKHGFLAHDMLVDAGWHCSFCFRYIEDFSFKMTAYAHADRVRDDSYLAPERIQKVICDGSDIMDLPPEAKSFYDLFLAWPNPKKTVSLVHLPVELVEHPEKYKFLLPGNCIRQLKPNT